jgi:hypothetical protein
VQRARQELEAASRDSDAPQREISILRRTLAEAEAAAAIEIARGNLNAARQAYANAQSSASTMSFEQLRQINADLDAAEAAYSAFLPPGLRTASPPPAPAANFPILPTDEQLQAILRSPGLSEELRDAGRRLQDARVGRDQVLNDPTLTQQQVDEFSNDLRDVTRAWGDLVRRLAAPPAAPPAPAPAPEGFLTPSLGGGRQHKTRKNPVRFVRDHVPHVGAKDLRKLRTLTKRHKLVIPTQTTATSWKTFDPANPPKKVVRVVVDGTHTFDFGIKK